jgi:hypothetical protein
LIFVLHTNLRIFSIDQTEYWERKKDHFWWFNSAVFEQV